MTQTPFVGEARPAVSTLQIRSARLTDVFAELAQPTLRVDQLESGRLLLAEVIANWDAVQSLTATAVSAGRPLTTEPVVSHYIAAVIAEFSYWWDELSHSEASADRFRVDLTDDVASVLGVPLTAGLVRRPIVGLVSDTYPYWGWATRQELVAATASMAPMEGPQRESQTVELRVFLSCVEAAVGRGTDVVTLYDSTNPMRGDVQ